MRKENLMHIQFAFFFEDREREREHICPSVCKTNNSANECDLI